MKRSPLIHIVIFAAFLVNGFGPLPAVRADNSTVFTLGELHLSAVGAMVHLSPQFNPPILKGIKVHTDDPFRFDFILDQGNAPSFVKEGDGGSLKQEAAKLIKYFLASLTIPEKDLWVNLSPYEKNRIVPQSFGLTEMGRDLLAEDYMLKQITASLIYPEDKIGKKFWGRIYEEAAKKFGTTNIPVNTFNKVWIVPEKAVVYENAKAGTAYVVESRLKVMLEQDYLALEKHAKDDSLPLAGRAREGGLKAPQGNRLTPNRDLNALGSQIVREIVIPELAKEVNEGKNFAQLRQVYNSLILAIWYKKKIKDSILTQVYANQNKVKGVEYAQSILPQGSNQSPETSDVELIYQRYLQAFKKGVYNYIKEEQDLVTQSIISRKYFSGGFGFVDVAMRVETTSAMPVAVPSNMVVVDMAMSVISPNDGAPLKSDTANPLWSPAISYQDIIKDKNEIFKSIIANEPVKPYDTTVSLIKRLATDGYKMGVGSSSSRALQYLDSFGIKDDFRSIIDGEMVLRGEVPGKPSGEFFKAVAGKAGIDPVDTIVFGDAVADVKSAKAGGFGLIVALARNENAQLLKDAGADRVLPDIGNLNIETMKAWLKEKQPNAVFKGAIFDVDGVIANSGKQHFDSWQQVLNKYLQYRQGESYKEFTMKDYETYFAGRTGDVVVKEFLDSRGIQLPARSTAEKNMLQVAVPKFAGVGGKYVYNSFIFQAKIHPEDKKETTVIAGRVEARVGGVSQVVFFQKGPGGKWYPIKGAPVFESSEDPSLQKIGDKWVLSVVKVEDTGEKLESGIPKLVWQEKFFQFDTLNDLNPKEPIAQGPLWMKDIHLVELEDSRIMIMTRPQGGEYNGGRIGYVIVENFKKFVELGQGGKKESDLAKMMENGKVLEGLFTKDQWGGANALYLLENGKIGVLGHIAQRNKEGNREYSPMTFEFDPDTGEVSNFKIIGTWKSFEELLKAQHISIPVKVLDENKPEDLREVLFPTALLVGKDGKCFLCLGACDSTTAMAQIPYPFSSPIKNSLPSLVLSTVEKSFAINANNKYGGIDLTSNNMNLQTQNAGKGIKFHLDPSQLTQLKNASGFVPVIINIQPMTNLRGFLELGNE
ncbi:MAG: DUF1861 family protein [Candidatus Omnitrophica bacterium]|nr:DUF1861 family protein [Candidatus Omnitrophota bacterium]